jgi:adenosine deaminase
VTSKLPGVISPDFVRQMPKVELHVHLEGSIRPETVLKLARRNNVALPADTVEGLREWYRFRDFPHFVTVYVGISKTIKTAADVELIAREFLEGQKAQNILHSEVTYTAATIEQFNGIPWPDQLAALQRAIAYGKDELGISMCLIIDIVRGCSPERAMEVAQWAVGAYGQGVCALGLAGEEGRGTSQHYIDAFNYAHEHGLPVIPHAGETQGAWSVAECLRDAKATRIGHGVRCLEDPSVVEELRNGCVTLEVCPSSNVCLNVFPSIDQHAFPELLREGLCVTINSDDPPMFGTTLTDEFLKLSEAFDLTEEDLRKLSLNAARAALVTEERRAELMAAIDGFAI